MPIEEPPDHDDYVDKGAGIFFLLVLIGLLVGGLYKAFTGYPSTSAKVTVIIVGGFAVLVICYMTCYVLGYLAYHLPEQIEKWR